MAAEDSGVGKQSPELSLRNKTDKGLTGQVRRYVIHFMRFRFRLKGRGPLIDLNIFILYFSIIYKVFTKSSSVDHFKTATRSVFDSLNDLFNSASV